MNQWYFLQRKITSHCVRMNGMITNRHNKVLQMVEDALTNLNKHTNLDLIPFIIMSWLKYRQNWAYLYFINFFMG